MLMPRRHELHSSQENEIIRWTQYRERAYVLTEKTGGKITNTKKDANNKKNRKRENKRKQKNKKQKRTWKRLNTLGTANRNNQDRNWPLEPQRVPQQLRVRRRRLQRLLQREASERDHVQHQQRPHAATWGTWGAWAIRLKKVQRWLAKYGGKC